MVVYYCFSRIKKLLGRTETRTRDRIYCQTIRTVRDISRDDRARIATRSLRTPTDRQTDRLKANYSIDNMKHHIIYTIILLVSIGQCSQTAGRNSCSIVSVDISN